ncbi:membrane protein insertase YidC [Thermomonospora umbrina]|uniref:Membrane protein insertase YidC n=1 Tax=Thermomonospora umbrina TaxID=111806 RepID=A0A3D9SHF2_9ACTN|nr:membrane protein insertase YidC [Thermomonospora umbrina]REE95322.1 YidC/Oxa1 family membrane protein insertase [Thermomonospora umbrina]
MLDAPTSLAYDLVLALTEALRTPAGGGAAVAAIALFTMGVRVLLLPLSVMAARGARSRARLAPQVAELRRRHRDDPEALRRELTALYGGAGVSPVAGCLPSLAQAPFFFVTYRLFVSTTIAGHQNLLLGHTLLGAPLGQNLMGVLAGGPFTVPALAFLGLFALLAAVAWVSSRQLARAMSADAPGGPVLRLMPYGTLAVAAFAPLAAGVYLLVSTAWTAGERAVLHRPAPA